LREPRAILDALSWCEGVMLGREAYHRPFVLAELQQALHPGAAAPSRAALIDRMAGYAARELAAGGRLAAITRHMLGLYNGEPGARDYRRALSEGARAAGAGPELLRQAIPAAA
jgi:tRNA-dihydrouridine synthase A